MQIAHLLARKSQTINFPEEILCLPLWGSQIRVTLYQMRSNDEMRGYEERNEAKRVRGLSKHLPVKAGTDTRNRGKAALCTGLLRENLQKMHAVYNSQILK